MIKKEKEKTFDADDREDLESPLKPNAVDGVFNLRLRLLLQNLTLESLPEDKAAYSRTVSSNLILDE